MAAGRSVGRKGAVMSRPLAVVTGASSGIGYELAKQFAVHGYDLLIAAEDAGIERAGMDLCRDGAVDVRTCQVDLATYDGVERLYRDITAVGRPADVIAFNAGRGA